MKPDVRAVGTFLAKADGVLAGLAVADMVGPAFHMLPWKILKYSKESMATIALTCVQKVPDTVTFSNSKAI